MERGSTRLGLAALALVVIWIVVFWWTPAPRSGATSISFGEPPERSGADQPVAQASDPIPLITPETAGLSTPARGESNAEPPRDPLVDLGLPVGRVVPPVFIKYTVQPGDTAHRISERFYGTTRYWQQIMGANPLVAFDSLRVGRVIRVPEDPNNVQGMVVDENDEPVEAPNTPDASPEIEYVVRSGDTLSEISQRIYGRSSLWRIIRDANREKVGDEGQLIRPGMTLTIPPPPPVGDE